MRIDQHKQDLQEESSSLSKTEAKRFFFKKRTKKRFPALRGYSM
jgi:hypothetical protein